MFSYRQCVLKGSNMAVNVTTLNGLVQAMKDANAGTGDNEIYLAPGIYDLTDLDDPSDPPRGSDTAYSIDGKFVSGLPVVFGNITIVGDNNDYNANASSTLITRGGAIFYRLFYVAAGGNLTLKRLTLSKGDVGTEDSGGGAIHNDGSLTVEECILGPDNKSNYGGAILNFAGTAELKRCAVVDNQADWGGGLYNYIYGTMNVYDSEIRGNNVILASNGGGIINFNTMLIDRCVIRNNSAAHGGGVSNLATPSNLTIKDSNVSSNTAWVYGGGFNIHEGNATIINCCVANNTAPTGAGLRNNTPNSIDLNSSWWGSSGPDATGNYVFTVNINDGDVYYPRSFCGEGLYPIFGDHELGTMEQIPVLVANDYDPNNHPAIDIVPLGAIAQNTNEVEQSWDLTPRGVYNRVFAVATGLLVQAMDGSGVPVPYVYVLIPTVGGPYDGLEFAYIHLEKTIAGTNVNAGDEIGKMVNWESDPGSNDRTHLDFRVRTRPGNVPQDPKLSLVFPSGILTDPSQVVARRFYP